MFLCDLRGLGLSCNITALFRVYIPLVATFLKLRTSPSPLAFIGIDSVYFALECRNFDKSGRKMTTKTRHRAKSDCIVADISNKTFTSDKYTSKRHSSQVFFLYWPSFSKLKISLQRKMSFVILKWFVSEIWYCMKTYFFYTKPEECLKSANIWFKVEYLLH